MKPVTAWAVLDHRDRELDAWSNDRQYQYPVFYSRKEARAWQREWPAERGKVVRVTIRAQERR